MVNITDTEKEKAFFVSLWNRIRGLPPAIEDEEVFVTSDTIATEDGPTA